ncbi:hypothetical protein [Cypionkella sp. TWP1-2-1b2]|uniref:hypothetical protein n=1 Tax=Cypionkella sp. TWP1-2-1b2 TaxID=2804675 RepID=UPI003CFB22E7
MDLLILGSLLLTGGLLALSGVFDGDDDKEDTPPNEAQHGTAGDDTLSGDQGVVSGWGGDDTLHLSGTAEVHGNQGDDTITAEDHSTAHGGLGEDDLTADGFSTLYGGGGDDALVGQGNVQGHGDAGNDSIEAYDNATMWGDAGDDRLYSGLFPSGDTGLPTTYGGAGNDLLFTELGHGYGGDGTDHLVASGFANIPVYDGLGTTVSGGDGSDVIAASFNAHAQGDGGGDTLVLDHGASGAGGAGDDTLVLNGQIIAQDATFNTTTASGGDGADRFVIDGSASHFGLPISTPLEITDFVSGTDHLLVDATGGPNDSYVYDHASVVVNADQGYTEVTLHWLDPNDPDAAQQTNVVRLNGVTSDFDISDIEIASHVHTVSGTESGPVVEIGSPLHQADGSAGNDTLLQQHDVVLNTGAGDDSVTSTRSDELIVQLGDGNDSFIGNGAAHVVYAGAGDDSYLLNAPNGIAGTTLDSGFYGGAGNDHIVIQNDGPGLVQPGHHAPQYEGGSGDDYLEAQAGTGALSMDGGSGHNILIGGAGQNFNSGDYFDLGSDDVTINFNAEDVAAYGPANVRLLGSDHLTLNIDANLQGEITFHYNTAGNGVEVNSTKIRVGGVTVAIVAEGIPLIEDAIAAGDSQLTVHRV